MSDSEERLLRQLLFDAYQEINPDLTKFGTHLITRLASGMYERGARIQIGAPSPPVEKTIHQSTGPDTTLVWACKTWREVMGYSHTEAVGQPVTTFFAPESRGMWLDFIWPALRNRGEKIDGVTVALLTSAGQILRGLLKSEVMRDSTGAFERTFTRIRVTLIGLFALACVERAAPNYPAPTTAGRAAQMELSRLPQVRRYGFPWVGRQSPPPVAPRRTLRPGSRRRFFG